MSSGRHKKQKRTLYIHDTSKISTQASTSTKAGRISTSIRHHKINTEIAPPPVHPHEYASLFSQDIQLEEDYPTCHDDIDDVETLSGIKVKMRYPNSDNRLATWSRDYRQHYLDALIQRDARGPCNPTYDHYLQLMDIAWFPSTPKDPRTCATYAVLGQFHTLNLQSKTTVYDYYKALTILTDATGLRKIPDKLKPFTVMVREWRHLKMMKRAGRGHDPTGILGTKPGELAVACRACPHPGINLPLDWDKVPITVGWIYQLFLSQDANFRLKNRLRSSEEKDPSLSPGWAYFVSTDEYLQHLAKYVDEDEISHCVGFAALWLANTRKAKGLRATGVGSVSCARHQMFRATGTGDLQRGERYSNMDFMLFSTLVGLSARYILLCYDIACQYSRNFDRRSKAMPNYLQLPGNLNIRFKVPKFHLPPHKPECHGPYSLNFTPGVGRTDGEGVERNWSWLNGAAPSTSQMGPGARHDTLDDFMGFWNYRRSVELETSLLKDMIRAIPEWITHRRAFTIFTETLQENYARDVQEWNKQVVEWEEDATRPDPYLVKEKSEVLST
ncbi:hypothetical protein H0H92_000568 [Tricholoma furcatifolium]|nr:hypothetical protein H0H92_000568 [Tricholoma furcatifolium]